MQKWVLGVILSKEPEHFSGLCRKGEKGSTTIELSCLYSSGAGPCAVFPLCRQAACTLAKIHPPLQVECDCPSNPRVGLGGPHWSLPTEDILILIPVMGWCQCSTQLQHSWLFLEELSNRTRATHWNKGNEFLLWMWSGTGASFPERMWSLHLWRYLRMDNTLSRPIWLALH